MKYFIEGPKRRSSHSSCYFEFQKGKYHDICWLSDSISIHQNDFDTLHLCDFIASAVPAFDYYGLTEITPEDWNGICCRAHAAGGEAETAIMEADPWVRDTFTQEQIFTICGI